MQSLRGVDEEMEVMAVPLERQPRWLRDRNRSICTEVGIWAKLSSIHTFRSPSLSMIE